MLNSKEFVRELQLRHESAWMNPNVRERGKPRSLRCRSRVRMSMTPRRGWSASLRSSRRYFFRDRG